MITRSVIPFVRSREATSTSTHIASYRQEHNNSLQDNIIGLWDKFYTRALEMILIETENDNYELCIV